MINREMRARLAGLMATLLPLAPAQATTQSLVRAVEISPDTVTSGLAGDTVPGPGASGAGGPESAPARVRLELIPPGS